MTMAYALFRRRNMPDFYCAVPEDKPTPPFITELAWEFMGESEPHQPRPRGFNEDVARFAANFQGYYTFRERSVLERRLVSGSI